MQDIVIGDRFKQLNLIVLTKTGADYPSPKGTIWNVVKLGYVPDNDELIVKMEHTEDPSFQFGFGLGAVKDQMERI